MAEPHETRILVRDHGGGKKEISVIHPQSDREVRTGLKAQGAEQTDAAVRKMKEQLERAGNRVTYREVDRGG